jgi:uncharacterized protein YbjT (DUF2867 family)
VSAAGVDPRPVLVTGATGTVGRHVVRGLLERGRPVRAAVRDPSGADLPDGVERVRLVFGDPASYDAAFEGVGGLFLMRPPQIADVRDKILPALAAARSAGVDRVAFLSLQGAGRNRFVPHRRVEDDLREHGPAWTMLRAGFFLQNLIAPHGPDIAERDEVFLPAGAGRTAFVDARDVGEAAAIVLSEPGHENRAYELTGREALTYRQVARALSDVLGREIRYVDPAPWSFWKRMRSRGHPRAQVAVMLALYTSCRLGLAAHVSDDLERLLGRPPRDVATFAHDYAHVWRNEAFAAPTAA